MQSTLWIAAASCVAVAGLAAVSDRRRDRRTDLDRIGWVPWPLILILALIAAAVMAAVALKLG